MPPSHISDQSTAPEFLAGGGEMGALIRAHDWSASPLGAPETWPQALRSAVTICLNTPIVSAVHWGPDLRILYNDAYAPALAERHPWALGRMFREVWAEIWDVLGPQIASVVETGRGFSTERQLLKMKRRGRLEDTYWIYSFAPLRDESGAIVGIFVTALDMTDKVLIEQRLTEQRERQRRLFVQAPGFISILSGPELRFEFVNEAYERLFGRRGFVGKTVRQAFPDLEGQPFFNLLDNAYATGERFVARANPVRLQATPETEAAELFLDFIYEPVRDETGAITGIFVEGYDVTEAHVAQEAVRKSESRSRALINASSDVVYRMNADWTEMSQLDGRGFLADADQPSVLWMEAHLFPEDRPKLKAVIEEAIRTKGIFELEHRVRRVDGTAGWTFSRAVPLLGLDGEIVEWFGMASDVTARKAAESELQRLNETLERRVEERTDELRNIQTFYTHSSEWHAVLAVRADGTFQYDEINPATLRLYGKSRNEVVGQTVDAVLGGVNGADLSRHLNAALAQGSPYRYLRAQGGATIEAIATPIPAEAGRLPRLAVTARDITERKNLEEQLRQAQKMEAIGQLTGGIAHDFNNLLAAFSGNLELLEKRLAQGRLEGIDRYLTAAQDASRRAAALTQRLLAFSRRQTLDPRPTDVNGLIAGMEDLIRRTVGPNITVEVVHAGGLWRTKVDPSQLESSLLNLCINARDAMAPGGGRLTIETANKWLDDRAAKERELPPGQYISVCVTDTGTGMSKDVIARVFEPFFTTKPLGAGTGLGLSMVYGFVRQSGGQVRIYSELSQGTTMCLYLPRFAGELTAEVTSQPEAFERGSGETVLVIDDEPMVRMLITEVLEESGYVVLEAADGKSGLQILQSTARIDLLITDVGLPGGLNGRQVADAARVVRPGLKVLFITGYAENAIVGNGHLDIGMEVITKPFSMDAMAAKVRQLIEAGIS